jgi:TonB dependent receptor/TonB-dependent Receptor Plug Domain/Carboxypeptidase regulatory-like domain
MRVETLYEIVLALGLGLMPGGALVAQPDTNTRTADTRSTTDTTHAHSLTGEVVDDVTGKPIALSGVVLIGVTVVGVNRNAVTDIRGRFVFRAVPRGRYAIRARRIGYVAHTLNDVSFDADSTRFVTLRLSPAALQLATVTVAPGAFAFAEAGPTARQTMTRTDIETAPFGEDLFRALNRLPGLSSGDYGASFSIRGGRQDETLILLDGLEIYEPFHLKDFNEGALSIFDVEAIDGVELLTGGFSAHYGDKRSGVMNISSRTPTGTGQQVTAGVSLTGAHALAYGSYAGGRGSWLVSGRTGFAGLVLGLIGKSETRAPRYDDAFATFKFTLHPRHALAVNVLHARDRYQFDINGTTGFNDTIRTRESANNTYGNSYAWLTLRSLVSNHLTVRSLASVGSVGATRRGDENRVVQALTLYRVDGSRSFTQLGLKQDYSLQPSDRVVIDWGFDLRRLHADYDWTNTVTQNPDNPTPDTTGYYPRVTTRRRRTNGTTLGAYLSNRWQIAAPVTLELGLRYDAANYSRDHDWSPRINALVKLSDRNTLRAGWGLYRQRQGIADENAFDRLDRYFVSELSRQWTVGLEHRYADGGSLRIEAYDKSGDRLRPVLRNWKSGLNVFPESSEDRILVYADATSSRGLELYHTRRLSSRANLRLGYAYAVATERVSRIDHINDPLAPAFAATHPNPQDQRHALNLDLTYQPARNWTATTAVTFHTGWPYTNEHGVEIRRRNGTLDLAVRPDSLYAARLPAYSRVDLRVTRRRVSARGELRAFVEVINLTNHENVLGYDIFRARDASGTFQLVRNTETWFSLLPSAGVTWTRKF